MNQDVLSRVTDLLWDVLFLVVILLAAVFTLVLLRGRAHVPLGGGWSARKKRLPKQTVLEELPYYAQRRAKIRKDKTVRRSWFGFARAPRPADETLEP
jgi:hypothetical protein